MKRFFVVIIFILVSYELSFAQLETIKWYFGRNAGVDLRTPNPRLDGNNGINTLEGVATFCDSIGNLLFYTDGRTIWNKDRNVMENGDGLIGHPSSTESAIIVPWPGNPNKYYVFVVDAERGDNGLSYSVVDLTLDGGLGAVTDEKNVQIEQRVSEKVTAIRNYDNTGFWILSRLDPGVSLVEYFVGKNGLDLSTRKVFPVSEFEMPVIAPGYDPTYAMGYMRVSPNGTKIACAIESSSTAEVDGVKSSFLEVFDFDPATGNILHFLTYLVIPTDEHPVVSLYGVEFSNDGSKLYFSSLCTLYQMDLASSDPEIVKSSVVEIATLPCSLISNTEWTDLNDQSMVLKKQIGALQLAINGKIYVTQTYNNYLGVINNPREKGADCNFEEDGLYLGDDAYCFLGLPNFIPSYFLPPNFTIENLCTNLEAKFKCTDDRDFDSWDWRLTDVNGNLLDKSIKPEFDYQFKISGVYRVSLTVKSTNKIDGFEISDYRFFEVFDPPQFSLGEDIQICSYDEAEILPIESNDDFTFEWENGGNDILCINETSEIKGYLTDNYTNCVGNDVINVVVVNPVEFSLGDDIEYCYGDSVLFCVELDDQIVNMTWLDNNKNNQQRYFSKEGKYYAQSIDVNGCVFDSDIFVKENPLPKIDFGGDTIICENITRTLDCGVDDCKYNWQNGETSRSIVVDTEGFYKVRVEDKNACVSEDSIHLIYKTLPIVDLGNDTLLCDGDTIRLMSKWFDADSYIWQDNFTGDNYLVQSAGIYSVQVCNVCGCVEDNVKIKYRYCGEFVFPNIITPNGDGINDYFKIKGLDDYVRGWHIDIYTREGKGVYHSDDYHNEWNAPNLSDGVYFYIFYRDDVKYSGTITVFSR